MPVDMIEVVAPSRLHFGMLSFAQGDTRQFGGIGAMIDRPGVRLKIEPAAKFEVHGPLRTRALKIVEQFCQALEIAGRPACRMDVESAPPEHVGLVTGTQLGMAIAVGLAAFLERDDLDYLTLAGAVGRGERSAIGTHGFAQGGLLVEAGKYEGEAFSPLVARVELPEAWRFVLITPQGERGLSGDAERRAFVDLPPVPTAATAGLCREVLLHLLPDAAEGRFERFSEGLYRYGHMAGLCFAANQGGPFASEQLAKLVEQIRSLEVHGVGQTSWGPTIFALLPDEPAAERFIERLDGHDADNGFNFTIAAPNNQGATVAVGGNQPFHIRVPQAAASRLEEARAPGAGGQ